MNGEWFTDPSIDDQEIVIARMGDTEETCVSLIVYTSDLGVEVILSKSEMLRCLNAMEDFEK